jgi:hypothetical protein
MTSVRLELGIYIVLGSSLALSIYLELGIYIVLGSSLATGTGIFGSELGICINSAKEPCIVGGLGRGILTGLALDRKALGGGSYGFFFFSTPFFFATFFFFYYSSSSSASWASAAAC